MFRKTRFTSMLVLLALVFGLVGFPRSSQARWREAQELPGMMSGSTLLLIGLGTAAGVTLIVLASRSHKPGATPGEPIEGAASDSTASSFLLHDVPAWSSASVAMAGPLPASAPGWRPPVDLSLDGSGSVRVGVSLSF